jgi:hypothetical protein
MKRRRVNEVAEELNSVAAALFDELIVRQPIVLAGLPLDPPPGEILAAPLDPGVLHGPQTRFQVGRIRLKGRVDAEG